MNKIVKDESGDMIEGSEAVLKGSVSDETEGFDF